MAQILRPDLSVCVCVCVCVFVCVCVMPHNIPSIPPIHQVRGFESFCARVGGQGTLFTPRGVPLRGRGYK